MNDLKIFEGHEVEVFELNGTVLFNPYHVGECLELSDSAVRNYLAKMNEKQAVILKNSDVRDKDIRKLNNAGEKFITESGVYKLVFKSRKPNAEAFTDWVTDEVLPQIRQTGGYIPVKEEYSDEEIMAKAFIIAQKTIEKKDAIIAQKDKKLEEQKPLVDFANQVSGSTNLIDVGKMSKLLKNEKISIGRNRLFEWLRQNGYLMRNNIPYQKYIESGYFTVKEFTFTSPLGTKTYQKTYITGKGQLFIANKLKECYS